MILSLVLAASSLAHARVGEWVTYRLDGGEGRVAYWRIAVVGEERDAVWLQLELGLRPGLDAPLQQTRVLAARATGVPQRVFTAFGLEPLREAGKIARAEGSPRPALGARVGSPTRLYTPGGTVIATALEVRAGPLLIERVWESPQIPVTGLARLELLRLHQTLEAVGWGVNAEQHAPPTASGAAKVRMEGPLGLQ